MGLDQYAFAEKGGEQEEIFYWRKHANLQGWMEDLYRKKGGKQETFNCEHVELTSSDLDKLEKQYLNLSEAKGFFWGHSILQDDADTATFIVLARQKMRDGYTISYSSWW